MLPKSFTKHPLRSNGGPNGARTLSAASPPSSRCFLTTAPICHHHQSSSHQRRPFLPHYFVLPTFSCSTIPVRTVLPLDCNQYDTPMTSYLWCVPCGLLHSSLTPIIMRLRRDYNRLREGAGCASSGLRSYTLKLANRIVWGRRQPGGTRNSPTLDIIYL